VDLRAEFVSGLDNSKKEIDNTTDAGDVVTK
jgi:hypothetical protein